MSAATDSSVDANQPDIYNFDTWVMGLEDVRQTGGYWSGIRTYAKNSDAVAAAYVKDESGKETNLVKQTYESLWSDIRDKFVAYESERDETGHMRTLAQEIEEAIHFNTQIMMMPHSPFVNAMYTWMMSRGDKPDAENPLKPEYYLDKGGKPLHQYGLRAKLLEGLGQDMLARSQALGCEHPTSWGFQQNEQQGVAVPKYIAKNADGTWSNFKPEELQKLLSNPNGPHVLMTANHAFLEDEKADLLSITGGVEELLRSSVSVERSKVREADLRAKELKFKSRANPELKAIHAEHVGYASQMQERYGQDPQHPDLHVKGIDEAPGKGDTVMVAAIYSRENNVLNLAHLFRRLDKINHHKDRSHEDDLRDVSPGSLMLASTILRTILDNPDKVKMVGPECPDLLKAGNGDTGRTETPELLKGGSHQFRDDAAERIRHLAMVGFSQGGNIMRDALRYVVHEIDRVQVEPAINSQADSTKEAAREILAALSVTAISLNEIAMNDYYKEYGVNCGIISNSRESRYRGGFIAPPPDHHHSTSDPVINIDAFDGYHGHHPGEMFNAIVTRGSHASSHFQCAFAPNVGKVALRYVRPVDSGLVLEVSGRSKEENLGPALDRLKDALSELGVPFTDIEEVPRSDIGRRQYVIKGDELTAPDVINKIQGALMKTDKSHIVVAQDVYAGLNAIARGKDVDETVTAQRIISNHMTLDTEKLRPENDPDCRVLLHDMEVSNLALDRAGIRPGRQ